MTLSEMTDADMVINPHFGRNLADLCIQIYINPEIQIRSLYYFRLTLGVLSEVLLIVIHIQWCCVSCVIALLQ